MTPDRPGTDGHPAPDRAPNVPSDPSHDEIAHVAAEDHPAPARRGRSLGRAALAVAAAAVLYLWDDALFAAPVVALAHAWDPPRAFLAVTPVYFGASVVVALLLARALERSGPSRPPRLSQWIETQSTRPGRRWAAALARGGSVVGFVVSSIVLGGIVTTLLTRHAGVRVRVEAIAVASSAIFAITFVGFYSGVSRLAFGIGR